MKIRQRLSAVFKLAVAEGHRTDNPIDAASAALPSRRGDAQRRRNQTALPYAEVADALLAGLRPSKNPPRSLRGRERYLTVCS